MGDMETWLGERLRTISEQTFCSVSHRKAPEIFRKKCVIQYFSVPLAAGVGQAMFVAPPVAAPRKDAIVLLFHGMGDDCTYPLWHWADALVSEGLSVLSIDWDGHGASKGSFLDLQIASRSIPLILQKLYGTPGQPGFTETRPGPRCFLMGHSTGGALTLLAATRQDLAHIVCGVIAVSPAVALSSTQQTSRELLGYIKPKSWLRDLFGRIPYYGVSGLFPAAGRFKRKLFPIRTRIGISYVDQLRAFIHETFEVRGVLKNVRVPVLWIHGSKDHVVPLAEAEKRMTDIPTAMYCHMDDWRGHLQVAFSSELPTYASRFVSTCVALGNH